MDPKDFPPPQPLRFKRSDDFSEAYANSVVFEATVWDLKCIFGQIDQAGGVIEQHTAITIPWSIVKLALYQLRAQVAAYELLYGKISISRDIWPPEPAPLSEDQKKYPKMVEAYEQLKKMREEFISSL